MLNVGDLAIQILSEGNDATNAGLTSTKTAVPAIVAKKSIRAFKKELSHAKLTGLKKLNLKKMNKI